MTEKIKIALLGLGSVGEDFAEAFLEMIQEGGKPVEIVAVAHKHLDSAVALGFKQNGVPVYDNAVGVAEMGDAIDIIFDLTGNKNTRSELREVMQKTNNQHTIIAPEMIAKLLWMFVDDSVDFNNVRDSGYN